MRIKKPIPFDFILETLERARPFTRPMFGCTAVYVGERIVMALRQKETERQDNGIWLATSPEHHASLKRDFPSMRSIAVLGKKTTGWQVLPEDSPDFEEAALRACELVLRGDPRVGKVPKPRKRGASSRAKPGTQRKQSSRARPRR